MQNKVSNSHPKGLYVLFFTEMWERFSYYGMRAIFVLYLVKVLMMSKETASTIYGNYTGLVYLTPLVGGYVADRYWGNKRSILFGGLLMAIGHFLLFCSASTFQNEMFSQAFLFGGLFFLIFGNGFFKPNISTMVGDLYEKEDKRKDSAYTIFYMGINIGAFFSPLVCGTLAERGNPEDFKWGFLAACVGMIIGVICFVLTKEKYLVSPEGKKIGGKPEKVVKDIDASFGRVNMTKIIGALVAECALFGLFYWMMDEDMIGAFIFSLCIVVPVYVLMDSSLTKSERFNIGVIIVLAFFVVFFWAAFEQAGASLTFFAEEQTDRMLGSADMRLDLSPLMQVAVIALVTVVPIALLWKKMLFPSLLAMVIILVTAGYLLTSVGEEVKTSYFQSLNPIFVIVFAPVMSSLWMSLERRNIHIPSPTKQCIGMFLLAIGYLIISFGTDNIGMHEKVSMMWIVSLYLILSLGELSLSPIGLSMVNQLSPARFASLMMSVWYLSTATANKFSGTLSALYPENGEVKSFLGYQIANLHDFFLLFALMAGVSGVMLLCVVRYINKRVEI